MKTFITCLILISIAGSAHNAQALSCAPPSVTHSYENANVVFSGKVTSTEDIYNVKVDQDKYTKVSLDVLDVYKGSIEKSIILYEPSYWGSRFQVDKEYLIFSHISQSNDLTNGMPTIGKCALLLPLDKAGEAVATINQILNK